MTLALKKSTESGAKCKRLVSHGYGFNHVYIHGYVHVYIHGYTHACFSLYILYYSLSAVKRGISKHVKVFKSSKMNLSIKTVIKNYTHKYTSHHLHGTAWTCTALHIRACHGLTTCNITSDLCSECVLKVGYSGNFSKRSRIDMLTNVTDKHVKFYEIGVT